MERFWSKVNKTDTCWLWTAARYSTGDAMFRFEGKTVRAHRTAWFIAGYVWPIPKGYAVSNTCRNKLCVRPDHLQLIPMNELMRTTAADIRFWSKVDKTGDCWLWTAAQNRHGYGDFYVSRTFHTMAHRFSWALHYGPIPEGLFVCHRCDTPLCVRPDHLFVGTTQDNMADMMRKGRHRHGTTNNERPHDPRTGHFMKVRS